MAKEIEQTKSSKNKQHKTYDELETYHQVAIDMKLDGYTYFAISIYLRNKAKEESKKSGVEPRKFNESHIRTWFMKDGLLRFAYDTKKKERSQERKQNWKNIDKQIDEGAIEAVAVLKKIMRGKSPHAARQAAADLIRLASLEPAQKHEVENKTPTTVVIDLEEIKNAAIRPNNQTEA